jgi:hypothetical protein
MLRLPNSQPADFGKHCTAVLPRPKSHHRVCPAGCAAVVAALIAMNRRHVKLPQLAAAKWNVVCGGYNLK